MQMTLNTSSIDDYRTFIRAKSLPRYNVTGRCVTIPDEYAHLMGGRRNDFASTIYTPIHKLFDYQREIAALAIRKGKFAVFADCGLGKSLILLEFARHAAEQGKRVLIVSPLMVVHQTIAECERFYANFRLEHVRAAGLQDWLNGGGAAVAITNYEAIQDDLKAGTLGALILDESSMLKSMYGKWGTKLIELGKGLEWKLCLTGTPAPNDRIEYGNHAVFLDQFPTLNAFLARYFVNRGQTNERWEMRAHAIEPFYRSLSHWCIFLNNPATYGWKDNAGELPPLNVHIHNVELTAAQNAVTQQQTGELFASTFGGIGSRSTLARIAKGTYKGQQVETLKYSFIKTLRNSFANRSTIIWALYNDEQDALAKTFPDAANIDGTTPHDERRKLIDDFKSGRTRTLISKAKILGFGLNMQVCTAMIFSSLQDSYESYYQCVKRANRYGATEPLEVHIPASDLELPMIENVLRKAKEVNKDTEYQERLFSSLRLKGIA